MNTTILYQNNLIGRNALFIMAYGLPICSARNDSYSTAYL